MKRKIQIKFLSIISIMFLSLAVSDILLSQDLFTPFNEKQLSPKQFTILKRLQTDSSTISLQVVKVNTNLFKSSNSVSLNLSSTKNSVAVKQKLEKRDDSEFSWFANIPGKSSDIIISVYKDAVHGYMVIGNECYNIHSLGEGLNVIVHVDPSKYAPCGNCPNPGNYSQNCYTCNNSSEHRLPQNNLDPIIKTEKSQTTNTIIRVLVAYTENAKTQAGGENSMNALITNSIASANDAFDSSNVQIELEPAYRYEVNHNESSNSNGFIDKWCGFWTSGRRVTLEQFQGTSDVDEEMNEIHVLRNAYAADICVLMTTSATNTYGQSYQTNVDEDEAFCIVRHDRANAAASWSFAHEIGHLLGGRHQDEALGENSHDPCHLPNFYAHGYRFVGNDQNDYRTMMHADDDWGVRIKYFANPTVEYKGTDTGDDDHYVALVLNQRRNTVSNFRVNHNINDHVTLTEDLEIQSGFTLTVQPDVIVEFDPGIKINIYGTMSAQGTPSQPITFTSSSANPQKGDWNGIKFDGATSSSSLKYCKIQYATRGLDIDNSDITIELNEIYNCSGYGIYIYDAEPTIYNNYIHDTDYYGIAANSAGNTYIRKNSIIDCDGGVVAWGNNSIKLRGTSGNSYGLNKIDNWGNGSGVYILGGTPDLGQYSPWNQRGYNDILRDSQYAVDNRTGSEVDAEKNYWGGAPQSSWFYGYVNYDFPLSSSQGAGSDLAKMTGMDADKQLLVKGNELLDAGRFKEASDIYKSLIDQFPDSRHAGKALAWAITP